MRALLAALGVATPALAQIANSADDEYTRYELLAPGSSQFKIIYDVTATTPGARLFFNPIRKGSEASDESVLDPATGGELRWRVVGGESARAEGFATADPETSYLRIELPRPVPKNGEVRLRIVKTYRDPSSYVVEGGVVTFARSLAIKRNAVVLPLGYEVIGVNYPAQILTELDGRTLISFVNVGPSPVPLVVKGRPIQ